MRRRHQEGNAEPDVSGGFQPHAKRQRFQHQQQQQQPSSSVVKSVFSRLSGPPQHYNNHRQQQHHQQHHHNNHQHHNNRHQQQQSHRHQQGHQQLADADVDGDDGTNETAAAAADDDDALFGPLHADNPQVARIVSKAAAAKANVVTAPPQPPPARLHSRVIRELPTRQEIVAAQGGADAAARARNRRMFGSLLGTLQKFCQEESRLKPHAERKAQIEQSIEAQQVRERDEMRRERTDLFATRKRQMAEIRALEAKVQRVREQEAWERAQQPLAGFVRTRARPRLYWLPKVVEEGGRVAARLAESRAEVESEWNYD